MPTPEERGRALQVAEFLTCFQSFYRDDDDIPWKGPITAPDVESAIVYRQQLHRHYALQNEVLALKSDGNLTEEHLNQWNAALEDSKRRLDTAPDSEKAVHDILRKFEVWSTKALAQRVLSYCTTTKQLTSAAVEQDRVCCAPLFNLPGALHLSNVLPAVELPKHRRLYQQRLLRKVQCSDRRKPGPAPKTETHLCSLALPPNAWTWREYLRVCNMVCLLPNPSEASTSSLTSVSSSLWKNRKDDLKLAETSRLTPADLVALWVRAQRNTSALLHLLHIFTVQIAPSEPIEDEEIEDEPAHDRWSIQGRQGGGKVLVQEIDVEDANKGETEEPPDSPGPPHYVAHYVGNHKATRSHVLSLSHWLDELVDWAVTNQVLFTYPYIRSYLLGKGMKASRKRPLPLTGNVRASKRQRQELVTNDELMFACESYVLKWFARRNRITVATLFSSEPQKCKEPFSNDATLVQTLMQLNVPDKVKEYMKETFDSSDRTFARIDRRIFLRKFRLEDGPSTFRDAIIDLLQAFAVAVAGLSELDVPAAIQDFNSLYDRYLSNKDAVSAARLLLKDDVDESDLFDLLKASPAPWLDRCCVCDENIDDEKFRFCDTCESTSHKKCATGGTKRKLVDLVSSFPPLAKIYTIVIPYHPPPPDFRACKLPNLTWTELTISVQKKYVQPGKLQTLGLGIRNTEDSEEFLERLLSKTMLVSELTDEKIQGSFPLAIDLKGVMIVDIFSGTNYAGEVSGLRQGDVITAIRFDEFEVKSRPVPSPLHDLTKLTGDERIALLLEEATKLTLTVQRPSKNILSLSSGWLRRVRKRNATLSKAFNSNEREDGQCVWTCTMCLSKQHPDTHGSKVSLDATVCQAIVRRLAMESHSLPFIYEAPATEVDDLEQSSRSQFVSLSRLDSMMEHIIRKQVTPPTAKAVSMDNFVLNPFLLPTWAKSPGTHCESERVDWAPEVLEEEPISLLCRGMERLLAQTADIAIEQRNDPYQNERASLSRHFAALLSAWCLYGDTETPEVASIFRPPLATAVRFPWLHETCLSCGVRPRTMDKSACAEVCDNKLCRRWLKKKHLSDHDRSKATLPVEDPSPTPEIKLPMPTNTNDITAVPRTDETQDLEHPTVPCVLPSTEMDESIRAYDRCASFVGSTLLVLPGDPLLQFVSKELNQSIDHMDRPVLLVVASYLPPPFAVSYKEKMALAEGLSSDHVNDGVFHVLPLLSARQVQYVLTTCSMRRPQSVDSASDSQSWVHLDVLNLEGVIRITPSQLWAKMEETIGIRESLDSAVAAFAGSDPDASLERLNKVNFNETMAQISFRIASQDTTPNSSLTTRNNGVYAHNSRTSLLVSPEAQFSDSEKGNVVSADDKYHIPAKIVSRGPTEMVQTQRTIAQYSLLVNNLLDCGTPLVRGMIAVACPATAEDADINQDPQGEGTLNDSEIEDNGDDPGTVELNGNVIPPDHDGAAPTDSGKSVTDYAAPLSQDPRSLGFYKICYTDFVVDSADEMRATYRALKNQDLIASVRRSDQIGNMPNSLSDGGDLYVTLSRYSCEKTNGFDYIKDGPELIEPYAGVGWGFELVRWTNDMHQMRIGRVHANSPASSSGLKMHDILLSVNGRSVESIGPKASLARALLDAKATNEMDFTAASPLHCAVPMLTRIAPVRDPVILHVRRGTIPSISRAPMAVPNPEVMPETAAALRSAHRTQGMDTSVSEYDKLLSKQNASILPTTRQDPPGQAGYFRQMPVNPVDGRSNDRGTSESTDRFRTGFAGDAARSVSTIGHAGLQGTHGLQRPPLLAKGIGKFPSLITFQDLYQPGLRGSVLSRVETAVLLEAMARKIPILGKRLLCPRYAYDVVEAQLRFIRSQDTTSIPRVQDNFWTFLVKRDYNRSLKETGPICFREGLYAYRQPTLTLPLDRIAESFLRQVAVYLSAQKRTESTGMEFNFGSASSPTGRSLGWISGISQSEPYSDELSGIEGDPSLARIRGGGDSSPPPQKGVTDSSSSARLLVDAPVPSWNNSFVYGACATTRRGTTSGETRFIGVVKHDSTQSEDSDRCHNLDTVCVSLFYISNTGYLPFSIDQSFRASHLKIVQSGSYEARIVENWQERRRTGKASPLEAESQFTREKHHIVDCGIHMNKNSNGLGSENHERLLDPCDSRPDNSITQDMSHVEASHSLSKITSRAQQGSIKLGNLPDGQRVLWLQSDPRALYIGTCKCPNAIIDEELCRKDTRLAFRNASDPVSSKDVYYCTWGCNDEAATAPSPSNQKMTLLSFPSLSELNMHISAVHTFRTIADSVEIGCGGRMFRIAEGVMIANLCAHLTASICARCPSLTQFAYRRLPEESNEKVEHLPRFAPPGAGMIFSVDKFLEFREGNEGRPQKGMMAHSNVTGSNSSLRGLMSLWAKISRLFDVEGSGRFHLTTEDSETPPLTNCDDGPVAEDSEALKNMSPSITRACLDETWTESSCSQSESGACALCHLDTVSELTASNTSAPNNEGAEAWLAPYPACGIGCSLYCQECFPPKKPMDLTATLYSNCGIVGFTKVLLTRIASCVPECLRRDMKGPLVESSVIWEEENYESWRTLVDNARDERNLTQAYVVLLHSVKKTKLPRWWKAAREGWSTAYAMLNSTSFSSLLLHLYVLDAAIAEYVATSSTTGGSQRNQNVPKLLQELDGNERIAKVLKWAIELDLQRFEGENDDECMQCGEGGEVMCCEFCSHVQHLECCQTPIVDASNIDWVCDSCVNYVCDFVNKRKK